MDINAIERVLDKRTGNGASDVSLISYLESLKAIHEEYHKDLDGLIDAIRQTPLQQKNKEYTRKQLEYINSVSGNAHQSAIRIIGQLERDSGI